MIEASREHLGWVLHESGPESADHTVLLLPGALCTAAFYDDLLAQPSLSTTPIRFVATTIPGFGGTAPPKDMSMESYSKLAGKLASDLGCDAVVGHSLGANAQSRWRPPVNSRGRWCSFRPASRARTSPGSRARSIASVGYSGTCPIR